MKYHRNISIRIITELKSGEGSEVANFYTDNKSLNRFFQLNLDETRVTFNLRQNGADFAVSKKNLTFSVRCRSTTGRYSSARKPKMAQLSLSLPQSKQSPCKREVVVAHHQELSPTNQEVEGPNPSNCWAFSTFICLNIVFLTRPLKELRLNL